MQNQKEYTSADLTLKQWASVYPWAFAHVLNEEWGDSLTQSWRLLVEAVGLDRALEALETVNPNESTQAHLIYECHVPPKWITAFRLERRFGGPEKGGWWYDAGVVEHTIPAEMFADWRAKVADLRWTFPDHGNRYLVAPQGKDYRVAVSLFRLADYPATPPQYN